MARSDDEAREALDLARRLGLDDPVVEAAGLLVYRMLLRDRGAIVELVDAVLSPLQRARSLTGYAATDPAHRFTLEAAVLGAPLLDWPATALPRVE